MWQLKNSPLAYCHVAIHVLKSSPLANGHVHKGVEKACIRRPMCFMKEKKSHIVEKEGREKEGIVLDAYVAPCVYHVGIALGLSKVLQS